LQMPKELMEKSSEVEFEIESEGKKFKFKRRILGWYDEEKIINECSEIDRKNNRYIINLPELQLKTLTKSLMEAPFEINEQNIKLLNKDVKDKILKEITPRRLTKEEIKK